VGLYGKNPVENEAGLMRQAFNQAGQFNY